MNRLLRFCLLSVFVLSGLRVSWSQSANFLADGLRYPFSFRGSYWTLSRFTGFGNPPKVLHLHDISRTGEMELLRIELLENGVPVPPVYVQTPARYTLTGTSSSASICFQDADILRVKARGGGIRLSYDRAVEPVPVNDRQFRIMIGSNRMLFSLLRGSYDLQGDDLGIGKAFHNPVVHRHNLRLTVLPDESGVLEFALCRYVSEYVPQDYSIDHDTIVQRNEAAFEQWLKPFAKNAVIDQPTYEAAFLSWSSLVRAQGNHKREGMLMSKTWMNGIWSWDHCFNAIAMMYYHPDVAWNQFMCMFDHQDEIGALPDALYVSDLQWGHLKQPMHGWTLMQMMAIRPDFFNKQRLAEIYPKLEKWTNFWLQYRDDDKNGIVQINHGNDDFDHLPVCDVGFPLEDPHINMMLAFQMEALAHIATKLGKKADASLWLAKADTLFVRLVERSWDGEKFVHKKSGSEEYEINSTSVLNYTPMMMGNRLAPEIRRKAIESFSRSGLTTEYGILTEGRNSPLFFEDSYTRGCIWPPLNLFIIEGLTACGEHETARELARRYISTASASGFSERFAPFTGAPLSDPSYTWSLSVYLILREMLAVR